MKKFAIVLILLMSLTNVVAQSKRIGTFQFQKKRVGHVAKVIFRTRAFDSSKKKVSYDENIGNTVNGRKAYGAEGIPQAEIASIRFFFDGQEIKVPRWLYSDCYDPNFGKEYVKISFSRDFKRAFVSMGGSDGAGGYEVVWVLRKNGQQSRYFKDTF